MSKQDDIFSGIQDALGAIVVILLLAILIFTFTNWMGWTR
jgi:hypothetical protein